jgi:hypothetical protein
MRVHINRSSREVNFGYVSILYNPNFTKTVKYNLINYLNNSLIIYNVGNVKVKLSLGLTA